MHSSLKTQKIAKFTKKLDFSSQWSIWRKFRALKFFLKIRNFWNFKIQKFEFLVPTVFYISKLRLLGCAEALELLPSHTGNEFTCTWYMTAKVAILFLSLLQNLKPSGHLVALIIAAKEGDIFLTVLHTVCCLLFLLLINKRN